MSLPEAEEEAGMAKEDEVRLIAYRLWEEDGRVDGRDTEHWFRAEAIWQRGRNPPAEAIGKISEFFARPVVAGIVLAAPLKIGDRLKIKGHTTDLDFTVDSIQVDNRPVEAAKAGDSVGIKVPDKVRKGDTVFRLAS
jgi:hypothetical protein